MLVQSKLDFTLEAIRNRLAEMLEMIGRVWESSGPSPRPASRSIDEIPQSFQRLRRGKQLSLVMVSFIWSLLLYGEGNLVPCNSGNRARLNDVRPVLASLSAFCQY